MWIQCRGGNHQKLGLNSQDKLTRRVLMVGQPSALRRVDYLNAVGAEIGARHDPRTIGSCDLRCCLCRSDAGLRACSSACDPTQAL